MWAKEEMRVSEAKSWQRGFTHTLCVTSGEISANNKEHLTAVAYKFQEYLVPALWSQMKGYHTLSCESPFCIPLPAATLSCNTKLSHAYNTDKGHNTVLPVT